ncbi:interleukin-1 receptor-associated kinase 4, partial [Elysia marginata]
MYIPHCTTKRHREGQNWLMCTLCLHLATLPVKDRENTFRMNISEETFLRNLVPSHQRKISQILDIHSAWETFAARIPTRPDLLFQPNAEWQPRYNTTHIHTFKSMNGSPTRNLLTDWGTKNVQLRHLVQ